MRLTVLTFLLAICSVCSVFADDPAANRTIDFDRDVRPILSNACFTCHGPDEGQREAGLRFDTREGALADLGGYAAVVPHDPEASELLSRIVETDPDLRMPPPDNGQQLTPEQVEILREWIEQGAAWADHWAFRSPTKPEFPTAVDPARVRNPIDLFVQRQLRDRDLTPMPEADRVTLLRRVTLDLTGLPPTLAEVDAFLADDRPGAYERAVDRLLASPRYGEHLALPWLDAARYADTNGYQQDRTRTLWPWRDYVVDALNADMPFDRFTIEQLAGDQLSDPSTEQLIATGFNRNHMLNGEGGRIAEESRVEYVVDRVDTTATVWLGLTFGCARCHDHKYDPIPQTDFFRMYALFNSIDETGRVDRGGNAAPELELPTEQQTRELAAINRTLGQLTTERDALLKEDALRVWYAARSPQDGQPPTLDELKTQRKKAPDFVAVTKDIAAAEKRKKSVRDRILKTMIMRDRTTPRVTYRLERGQWDAPDRSAEIPAALPTLFEGWVGESPPSTGDSEAASPRLTLARWLVSQENPLTARVVVNRAWQQFFGNGLVRTIEDFGSQGERPSHPQLLDWLAIEYRESGWDTKHLHRLIVTSATYRQSSSASKRDYENDPENRWLARGPRHRLTSHALRDQALFVSGLLVERLGGPPVKSYQPAGVWSDMTLGKIKYQRDSGENLYRRSLYSFWRRSVGPTMLFDSSTRQVCTVRVSRTNTPLHALTLLNDITFVEAARALATRVHHRESSLDARLRLMFRTVTLREPTVGEQSVLKATYDRVRARFQGDRDAATELLTIGELPVDSSIDPLDLASETAVANLLLNLDEVLTKQ